MIQYVAENAKEVVAECIGQDESGHWITWFLVVDKCWLGESSWRVGHGSLPKALDMEWYLPWGCLGNDVPFPHFSFSLSKSSSDSQFSVPLSNVGDVSDSLSIYQSVGVSQFSVSSFGSDSNSAYLFFLQHFFCLA